MRTLDTATSPLAQAIREYEHELANATSGHLPEPTTNGINDTELEHIEQQTGFTLLNPSGILGGSLLLNEDESNGYDYKEWRVA